MDINLIILIFFMVSVILILRFTGINESVNQSDPFQIKPSEIRSITASTTTILFLNFLKFINCSVNDYNQNCSQDNPEPI